VRSRGRHERAWRGGVAVAVVLGLLGVVALASAGARGGGGVRSGPSHDFVDYALSAAVVLWILMAALFAYAFIAFRDQIVERRMRRSQKWFQVRFFLIWVTIVGLLVLIRGWLHRNPLQGLQRIQHAVHKPGNAKEPAAVPHTPQFHWSAVVAVVIVLVFLVVLTFAAWRERRARVAHEDEIEEALATVLDEALADLRAEPDVRKAIIGAYARMERLLGAHGHPRDASEAPFEYLSRVLAQLRVTRRPAAALTELFERAKFSTHELGPDAKQRAIEALEAVRDELRDPVDVARDRTAAVTA
jgi:heme/copper-type cytochrome/quinol oxidase subunit 2